MGSNMSSVSLGFLVGAIPTVTMTLSSIAFTSIRVSPLVEAAFQNFAAGLILAAVACELFPLMIGETISSFDSMIGITAGFGIGLFLLNSVEAGIEFAIRVSERKLSQKSSALQLSDIIHKKTDIPFIDIDSELNLELLTIANGDARGGYQTALLIGGEWEEEPVEKASMAMAAPNHKHHLMQHVIELGAAVLSMEAKADTLIQNPLMPQKDCEQIAEEIDEAIHSLQYKLDHCKRLLQGSEYDSTQISEGSEGHSILLVNTWVTDEKKLQIKGRLTCLKSTIHHLLGHIQEEKIDKNTIQEMHEHMMHLDAQLSFFHSSVESASSKWRRSRPTSIPETNLGDTIPVSLLVPVVMDCFIDGFLIGVTCALSPKAGIILGAANSLEMAFLGMAYTARIVKCTGSSNFVRFVTLYSPPLLMFLASGLGALIAQVTQDLPAVHVAFGAFGAVTLLALVCNELLIEAKEAQGDDHKWWINILIFAGIYLVLMMNRMIFPAPHGWPRDENTLPSIVSKKE